MTYTHLALEFPMNLYNLYVLASQDPRTHLIHHLVMAVTDRIGAAFARGLSFK